MTTYVPRVNSMRNERFMSFYIDEFKRLSAQLFYGRADVMLQFYGKAFDRHRETANLINGPASLRVLSPTMYIVCREAKFVLDSELSEAEELDSLWAQFHALVATERNRYALAAMEAAHTNARRQIVRCRSEIMSAIPECLALLDNQFAQARRFADGVIADAEQMLQSAINSYPKDMTLSKIS